MCSGSHQRLALLLAALASSTAAATSEQSSPPPASALTSSAWQIGGWLSAGGNYNTHGSQQRSNGPVIMTDRNSQLSLYQSNVFIEKAVNHADHWSVGGRVEALYGSDAKQTQAIGNWDSHLINPQEQQTLALPQAYLELFAPIGSGINLKLGHFYSVVGYESVPSPLNFFASHSYTFHRSPSTTSGALLSYALTSQWTVQSGVINGPDHGFSQLHDWGSIHRVDWNNPATGTSAAVSLIQGDLPAQAGNTLVYYSAVIEQRLGDWHTALQHDRGLRSSRYATDANGYSLVHYLSYTLTNRWRIGIRNEWFRDADSLHYGNGAANYQASTLGLNWTAHPQLLLRPEIRYDWSDSPIKPFDNASRSDQLLLGLDAVFTF